MSLKKQFEKNINFSNIVVETSNQLAQQEVESLQLINSYLQLSKKNISNIDWLEPKEFARYGSAQKYYEDSINQIYKTYPYDGSYKEKLLWEVSSSALTNFMFDNYYPRTTGYINIGQNYGSFSTVSNGYQDTSNPEYIHFHGTLNVSPNAKNSKEHFELSNKLDKSTNREFNLNLSGDDGCTVEFFLKKQDYSGSPRQIIFDLWNAESVGSSEYGRFRIEIRPGETGDQNKFFIELRSGSAGVQDISLGNNIVYGDIWKHYAITAINQDSQILLSLYVDGDKKDEILVGSSIGNITKALQAQIGSLITGVEGTSSSRGWGKLSASLDEFRYWKTKRADKDIKRFIFTNIGSGVNTDDSNTKLGVYFKFNEGIMSDTSVSSYDKIVLDYSGRISNGIWTGYSVGSRNTGSAIVDGQYSEYEFEDPILYSNHPKVVEVLDYFKNYGSEYDVRNENSMLNTLPSWIVEQDFESGESLRNICQIMSEFFDDIYLKIKALPSIKNMEYETQEEISFTEKLLKNVGFDIFNVISDTSLLEEFLTRNEEENYEEKFFRVRNQIYKNLYNNILEIYRSKGTTRSFRNLLHCFGIDENLVKINLYANDLEYVFEDRYYNTVLKKKSIDFNDADRYLATIYQKKIIGNVKSLGYIPGDINNSRFGNSFETSIIFPKKFQKNSIFHKETPFLTSSLFGIHNSTNGTWNAQDKADLQVVAIRQGEDSSDVKFAISSSYFGIFETTDTIAKVYENEKWNFCLSIKPEKERKIQTLQSEQTDYIVELYGVNSSQNNKLDSFILQTKITKEQGEEFFQANKMIYAGAHRQNFIGSVINYCDIKLLTVRYWNNYLENKILDIHSKDESVFGIQDSTYNIDEEIVNLETLVLDWEFNNIESTDSGQYPSGLSTDNDAGFIVKDVSSALLDNQNYKKLQYQFDGKGDFFLRNDESAISMEYLPNANRMLPESVISDDLVQILEQDDEFYKKDSIPIEHYFSVEKSMHQIISKEMSNWIGSIVDFGSIIGNPKSRYEDNYDQLDYLRQVFFSNVENEPDFNEFLEFYKWIDEAIYTSIMQISPASLNTVSNVFNVYESHILERNKYRHKLPTIEFKGKIPEAPVENIIVSTNRWFYGCNSKYKRAIEKISERGDISSLVNKEINRREYLVYNIDIDKIEIINDKKRVSKIIKNEVGFDLTGTKEYQIDITIPVDICKDDY